ncbi:SDR family oxidoreductase [Horticoccus luteus]|uniref:SDR family oxidoreductase n=1 Tax=Horticoccus luteus TaxID=2862869 RepID=A0A8F9TT53_9BACT|nr:SDR family oxidoreductase [Horticoccus luteus]QYM78586.1 SDR family oxidoreductase [Horticoccus luteus]
MPDLRSFSLQDKVILQFGGSGLLGRALIADLSAAGATLVVASRQAGVLATETKPAANLHLETVDLLDEASLHALLERIARDHGQLHGVVYNAVNRPMSGMDAPLAAWEESMRLNATGFFAAVRACGDVLARAGRGSIVNISSQMGVIGPNYFLYEGSAANISPDYFFHKGGMNNLTRYLAAHYGRSGVRVNTVSPGGIYNPVKPQAASFLERYAKMTMLGRMAEAREIGGAVTFLLSDASTYITGANLPVDGGYTAK